MNDDKKYSDPTNHVICIFDDHANALDAKAALIQFGFGKDEVHVLRGDGAAAEVDTSAKWFADTDIEMKRFERELRAGNTIVSAPVKDCDCREEVHTIMKAHNARHIVHFGEWITEVMR